MNDYRVSRRRILGGAAATAFGVAAMRVAPAGAQATPATAEADAFPVTISHVYGETTFEAAPQRIVTVSWINQDAAIALGTIPVGMPFVTWGGDGEGFLPWTRAAIGDNPLPILYDDANGLPFEQIVTMNPDAIIGVYSGMTKDEYDTLTKIAPTVAFPTVPFGTPWEETTRVVGQIMGKGAEADALVQETIGKVQAAGADYPRLQGKTFAYGSPSESGLYIYTTVDARVQLLSQLGMTPSPFVESLPVGDEQTAFYVDISSERFNEIDADILILWFGTQDAADQLAKVPTMQGIPAYTNGAYVPIVGETNVMAVSAPSPLSIPYVLDTYVPELAAAADKVPAA